MGVEAIGYSGQALGHAMRLAPHVEKIGFSSQDFVQQTAEAHAGMGLIKASFQGQQTDRGSVAPGSIGADFGAGVSSPRV